MASEVERMVYRDNLTLLIATRPIINSPHEVQIYCPHLKIEQIQELWDTAQQKRSAFFFSAPSICVKHAYHMLTLFYDNQVMKLIYGFTGRMVESYKDKKPHGEQSFVDPRSIKFLQESIAYANAHWPTFLVIDDWESVGTIALEDPTDLVSYSGFPKTKSTVFWAVNRNWKIIQEDRSKTVTELWDDALSQFTFNEAEWQELRGGREEYNFNNCSKCGANLQSTACTVCNVSFNARLSRNRCFGGFIPEKIVPALQLQGLLDKRMKHLTKY